MIEIPSVCVARTTDSNIVFRENKARICFLNSNRKPYDRITVDGCVIREGNKCDFLLASCEYSDQYFVELKGENLEHAVVQLESTFTKMLDGWRVEESFCGVVQFGDENKPASPTVGETI